MKFINPSSWKAPSGYNNAVLAEGKILSIAGQIGWNKDQVFESHSLVPQVKQTLLNIVSVVKAAGGTAQNIVRLTWFVRDKRDYNANKKQIGEVYREVFSDHFPAMSLFQVSDLLEDEALVEIEATAVLQG